MEIELILFVIALLLCMSGWTLLAGALWLSIVFGCLIRAWWQKLIKIGRGE